MIAEVTLVAAGAEGFSASSAFYDAALGTLGLTRVGELVDEEEDDAAVEAVGWGPPDGPAELWLVAGEAATTGLHLRIRAKSRAEVETFAAVAAQSGGTVRAAPRRWTPYRRGEYAATAGDPAGNLIEVVAPE